MDIHIWVCRYPKLHIDNHPFKFRYLYKSMDIHTKVSIPDVSKAWTRLWIPQLALSTANTASANLKALLA